MIGLAERLQLSAWRDSDYVDVVGLSDSGSARRMSLAGQSSGDLDPRRHFRSQVAIKQGRGLGYASAIAIILFGIILCLYFVQRRFTEEKEVR